MNAEIICIAAELLPEEHSSFITAYISKKLFELGHRTTFETVCPPDKAEIESRLSTAFGRSDLIIILGGIEPETNSIAKTSLSSFAKIPLVASEEALASVKSYCSSIGVEPTPEQLSTSIILKGASVFKNELGLSVGLSVKTESAQVFLLPYAEGELTHMFEAFVAPALSPYGISAAHTVNVVGLSEENIENMLSKLNGRSEYAINIERHGAEYAVRISAVADTKEKAEIICSKAVASVKFALGKSAYAVDSNGIQFETVKLLREKGLTVSTAESCTAGMVSEMLTDVGGSSEVFEYGISAYSNRIKTEILKVPEEVLNKYSAISYETAKAMATNVRALSGATLGIGITGNAGPTASENKPVGLVYVALADEQTYIVKELHFPSDLGREEIRCAAAATALDLVRCYTLSYPDGMAGMMKYTPNPELIPSAKPEIIETPTEPIFVVEKEPVEEAEKEPSENTEKETDVLPSFTMVFDRDTDEDFFDETMSEEYKFTKGFSIREPLENIKSKSVGFFKNLIPIKGDSPKKLALKIGFFVSLIVFITSATVLWTQLTGDEEQRDIIMQAQEKWHTTLAPETFDNTEAFEPFYEKNEDIKGWITIGGTKVDNPIYQTTDNDYYLTHNMYKEKSRYGALFFDYRCDLSLENPSQNLTVYGHEMKDGSMFGTLKNYKSLSQYKQNPTFTVSTPDKTNTYKIFSVMVVNAKPEDDNGYLFNYTTPSFSSQKAFLKWIDEARERSIISTDIDVAPRDKVITLVTCINDFDDARFVIMARLTRENESTHVASSTAALNPNPRYPKAWYDKRGQSGYVDPNSSATEDTVSQDISSVTSSENLVSDSSSGAISSVEQPTSSAISSEALESKPASSQATSSQVASSQTTSSQATSSQAASSQAAPGQTTSGQTTSSQPASGQTTSSQTTSSQATSSQATSSQATSSQATSSQAASSNAVSSTASQTVNSSAPQN